MHYKIREHTKNASDDLVHQQSHLPFPHHYHLKIDKKEIYK
jgi:hypothetical protein